MSNVSIPAFDYTTLDESIQIFRRTNARVFALPGSYGQTYTEDAYKWAKSPANLDNPQGRQWAKATREQLYDVIDVELEYRAPWLGLLPSTAGLIFIDIDEEQDREFDATLKKWGLTNYLDIPTPKKGRHIVGRAADGLDFKQKAWRLGNTKGDLRHSKGFIILWDPARVAAAIQQKNLPVITQQFVDELYQTRQSRLLPPAQKQSQPSAAQGQVNLDHYLSQIEANPSKHYPAGARENQLMEDIWFLLPRRAADQYYDRLLIAWLKAHNPAEELKYTREFNDRLNRSKEKYAENDTLDGATDNVITVIDTHSIHGRLTALGIAYSKNVRTDQLEYKDTTRRIPDTNDVDTITCSVLEHLNSNTWLQTGNRSPRPLRLQRATFEQIMVANCHMRGKSHDPFLKWLDSLPPHDPEDSRIGDDLLRDLFDASCAGDPSGDLVRWAAAFPFLAAIDRAYNPGARLHESPVFYGPSGCGKSSFIEQLLPEEHQDDWFEDQFDITAEGKERREMVDGRVLIELGEMHGVGRWWKRQKVWLTSRRDTSRRAWAKGTSRTLRRFALIGTADEKSFLPRDPAGNRRFVVIEFNKPCQPWKVIPPIRDFLWAEWHYRYLHENARPQLPPALKDKQASQNNHFVQKDELMDDIPPTLETDQIYTIRDILKEFDLSSSHQNTRKLKSAMEMAGWVYGNWRHKGGRRRGYAFKNPAQNPML